MNEKKQIVELEPKVTKSKSKTKITNQLTL